MLLRNSALLTNWGIWEILNEHEGAARVKRAR